MASKKPTAEQVRNVLGVGMFESRREIQDADPLEPVSMKLPIDQVEPYDRNPRRVRNPEYDAILESLRANGQDEALTITRRPGSEKYMIKRGGNTRLEIMKMLYHEAGDERFAVIDCLFKPWDGEAACILGHLTENTTQGQMTLIDKARGYREFKEAYEQEHGIENLGQRKLAALLKEKGAAINTPLLGVMNYALDVLEPAIPETLNRGLGKPQIEKLKRLNLTFERLAEAHGWFDPKNREEQVRAEFHNLLSEHDGDEWDMELVIHEFTQRLGGLLEDQTQFNRLKFDIDECLKRDPWKVELLSTLPDDEPPPPLTGDGGDDPLKAPPSPMANDQQTAPTQTGQQDETHGARQGKDTKSEQEGGRTEPPAAQSRATKTKAQSADAATQQGAGETSKQEQEPPSILTGRIPETSYTAGEFDIKSHRARIYTLALQFAKATRNPTSVMPWHVGYGFFLEMPSGKLPSLRDKDRKPEMDVDPLAWRLNHDRKAVQRTMGWWALFLSVGFYDCQADNLVPAIEQFPEGTMREVVRNFYALREGYPNPNSAPNMASTAWYLSREAGDIEHPVDLGMMFTYLAPDQIYRYLELLEARTQLQAVAEEQGIDLWEVRS